MLARPRASLVKVVAPLLLLLSSFAPPARAQPIGGWTPTTSYPIQVAGTACSVVGSNVYCVGGFDENQNSYNDVYYAPINETGIGAWEMGAQYPTAVDSASCVSSGSAIYCVGGEDGQQVLDNVYYAQVTTGSTDLGQWTSGATYPQATAALSCVVYAGYVYCVGGFNSNDADVSATYYAPLGSPGVDSWSSTTPYPKALDGDSCVASAGYIFCFGGGPVQGGGNPTNYVYYAQLTSSGIGKWNAGPTYPAPLAALSCVPYSGYVYCTGGFDATGLSTAASYYAAISPSGVGSWTSTTPYPVVIDTSSCVVSESQVYCIAGVNGISGNPPNVNYAYFASLGGSPTTTTPEFPAGAAVPAMLAVLLGAGALVRRRDARA